MIGVKSERQPSREKCDSGKNYCDRGVGSAGTVFGVDGDK